MPVQPIVFKLNESSQWYEVAVALESFSHILLPDGRLIHHVGTPAHKFTETTPIEACGFTLVEDRQQTQARDPRSIYPDLAEAICIPMPSLILQDNTNDRAERIVFKFEECWYEVQARCYNLRFAQLPDGRVVEHIGSGLGSYMLSIPPEANVFRLVSDRPFPGLVNASACADPFQK